MNNKLTYAIVLALTTAFISGTSNFFNKIAVTIIPDATVNTFLMNAVVAVFLIGLLGITSQRKAIKHLTKIDIIKLTAIGLIGGSLPFVLFFKGLALVPAVNAAFIHKTLFIWVALLAVPLLKERIGKLQLAALALLIGGNLILFKLPKFTFGTGELMILAATILWATENIIAKLALRNLPSLLVATARMFLGSLIILAIITFQGKISLLVGLTVTQWSWSLFSSLRLTIYVLTWYTALKYAPATLVASLLVPATLITNVLTAVFITHVFPTPQLISGVLLALGTVLLISCAPQILPRRPAKLAATISPPA